MLPTIAIATATTATPALVAATPAAAPARALFARTRFVDRESAALEVLLVEHFNGLISFSLRAHLDEGEAAGTAGRPILHDVDRHDRASLGEIVLEVVFGGVIGEVTYE